MNVEQRLIHLAATHGGLATRRLANTAGLSDAQWRRLVDAEWWLPVAPGWYRHAATPLTFEMQVRAGAAWLGRRGGLDGTSALRWWGVDVPEPNRVEFLVPRGLRSIPKWMTVHTTERWDPNELVRHRGVPLLVATRALITMAGGQFTARQVENAIDSSIRLRRTAMTRLRSRFNDLAGAGTPGTRLLRELLLDSGGESLLERRFLRIVRQEGLPRPRCQVVKSRRGERVVRVDFAFDAGFVVEVTGRLGHTSDRHRQSDARRRNRVQLGDEPVYEFTTADVVDDPKYVIRTLRQALRVAAQRGRPVITPAT